MSPVTAEELLMFVKKSPAQSANDPLTIFLPDQCGWLLLMDDCRTDAYRLSSASCTVSMTVLVVFSMLSLPCGVDDLRSCRRRFGLP